MQSHAVSTEALKHSFPMESGWCTSHFALLIGSCWSSHGKPMFGEFATIDFRGMLLLSHSVSTKLRWIRCDFPFVCMFVAAEVSRQPQRDTLAPQRCKDGRCQPKCADVQSERNCCTKPQIIRTGSRMRGKINYVPKKRLSSIQKRISGVCFLNLDLNLF